jgi:hypothetical protein
MDTQVLTQRGLVLLSATAALVPDIATVATAAPRSERLRMIPRLSGNNPEIAT